MIIKELTKAWEVIAEPETCKDVWLRDRSLEGLSCCLVCVGRFLCFVISCNVSNEMLGNHFFAIEGGERDSTLTVTFQKEKKSQATERQNLRTGAAAEKELLCISGLGLPEWNKITNVHNSRGKTIYISIALGPKYRNRNVLNFEKFLEWGEDFF